MSENARQSLHAVFEGGVFRPLSKPWLDEGAHVHLLVETTKADAGAPNALELLGRVYDGLSDEEIADLERIILARGVLSVPSR